MGFINLISKRSISASVFLILASSLFDFPSFSSVWRLLNGVVVNNDAMRTQILLKVK
ncbi:hypothetical protein LPC_1903 [Legionella pneumophila str. Corby]|nr:hypothetical protein LPC_1903 [Legionella pneumophila str. Corby]